MKLFNLLLFGNVFARRIPAPEKCDKALLPEIEHAEWVCENDGDDSKQEKPEKVRFHMKVFL